MSETSSPTPAERKTHRQATPRPPRPGVEWLEPAEAAFLLGISVTTLARYRVHGTGPRFVCPRPRVVRYHRRDLEQWLGTPVASTSQAQAQNGSTRGAA